MRRLEQWLADRRWQKLERRGLVPGGRWLRIDGEGCFVVNYMENHGRFAEAKRWIALAAYCNAKQGGTIRPVMSAGEYQRQLVVAGEGDSKVAAWYSLSSEIDLVLARCADGDWPKEMFRP